VIQIISLFAIILLSPAVLALPSIVFGFSSFGLLAVSDAFLSDITPIRSLGKIFGLNFTVNFISAAILPLIFGSLIDIFGYNNPFFDGSIHTNRPNSFIQNRRKKSCIEKYTMMALS
jgi:MFS family permease